MVLYIGESKVLNLKEVIAIIDCNNIKNINDELNLLSKTHSIHKYGNKSLIISKEQNQNNIYLSPITASTLLKRCNS